MSYYEQNKEHVRTQHKEYYARTREERLLYQNNYNMLNEMERKEKNRIRYWSTRDMNKVARIPPRSVSVQESIVISFTPSFD